ALPKWDTDGDRGEAQRRPYSGAAGGLCEPRRRGFNALAGRAARRSTMRLKAKYREILPFVEDHASACTDPRRRRLQAGTKTSFTATKQICPGMKPFSGFHEGMVKRPAIRARAIGNTG